MNIFLICGILIPIVIISFMIYGINKGWADSNHKR